MALPLVGVVHPAMAQRPERRPSEPLPLEGVLERDTLEPRQPALVAVERLEPKERLWLIDLDGLYGFSIARYNRIDGLTPAWGLMLEPTDPTRVPGLGGRYARATTRTRGYWNVGIEQRLPLRGEVLLRLEHFQRAATFDDWRVTRLENSLATLLVGKDLMDWWREKGFQVSLDAETIDGRLGARLTYLDASQHSQANHAPFALFGDDDDYRLNPRVDEGDLHSLGLSVRLDTRDVQSPLLPTPGWVAILDLEGAGGPLGGDIDFRRALIDVRRYNRFGRDVWWDWRAVWMGPLGDDVPPQRQASLGGPGSLRGFPAASFVGDEALQIVSEARFPLPVTRAIALLFLSWHAVGFVDAAAVDDYGDWHADVGAGVSGINLFSYVGFFVAQRVTDRDEPDDGPRFIVRLRRDF